MGLFGDHRPKLRFWLSIDEIEETTVRYNVHDNEEVVGKLTMNNPYDLVINRRKVMVLK